MVKLGLYDDALPWLEEARRALPKDPAPAVELGLAQIGLNNQVGRIGGGGGDRVCEDTVGDAVGGSIGGGGGGGVSSAEWA